MWRRNHILLLLAALAGLVSVGGSAARQVPATVSSDARALVEHTIANQHRNDVAVFEYERIERHYSRAGNRVAEDFTYRVVPTGTGTLKLLLKENGQPVAPALYQKELRDWEQVLNVAVNPTDPRERQSEEKMRRREKDRAELVGAVRDAYNLTWLGREAYQGRATIKIRLEPNPAYQPRSRMTEMLGHLHGTVWIDENAAQLVHAEAELVRDVNVGSGLLGKIYRGGRFRMDQTEVAPGVWLPAHIQYDFEGRKFLFTFSVHQTVELSRYVRRGKPNEALAEVRSELATGRGFSADP